MISLVNIINCEEHFLETYRLLKLRNFSISHKKIPSFEDHKEFVLNHPYRYWLLVQSKKECIGTVYIKDDNSIGLNIISDYRKFTKEVLTKVVSSFDPLPPLKSLKSNRFIVNVALEDNYLADAIKEFGGLEIQRTFLIPKENLQQD